MKRILLLVSIMLLAGAANARINIVTTTSDLASITNEVGGDRVTVQSIARGFQDPHFVEAKPSFLMLLRKADLLEVVGLDLEIGWLPSLLDQSRNSKIRPGGPGYLDASAHVEILDRPTGAVNRSMGDVHPMGNPHYWLDPGNAIRVAMEVRGRLAQIDPQGAAYYSQRLESFRQRVIDANERWTAMLAPYKGAKVVTYHNSWPNFVRRYRLNVVGYIEPKPGVPPSPSHTFDLIQLMKRQGVKVIMVEPYFDMRTPQAIAAKTGAKVVVMQPSVGGTPDVNDYFKLFDRNIKELVKALQ